MTDPILTEQDLATLLKVPGKTVETLLTKTDLPRFTLEGKVRFLTHQVLQWLEARTTAHSDIFPLEPTPPAPPPKPAAQRVARTTHLPPARQPEHPWVSEEALSALSEGAGGLGSEPRSAEAP